MEKIVTSIKQIGGSKAIILPKHIIEMLGDDVLVTVGFEKYVSTYQDLLNQHKSQGQQITIVLDNSKISGDIIDCDQEKVKIKQTDETYVIFYKDIEEIKLSKGRSE